MVLVEHHYYDTVYCVKQCLFSGDFTGNRRTDVGTDYRKYFHKNLLYLNCKTVAGDIDMGSDDTEKKQSVFKMAGVAVNFTDSDCGGIILISLLEINLNTGIYGKEQGHILGIFTLQLVILGCCTFLALHISKMNQRMNEGKIVAISWTNRKQ